MAPDTAPSGDQDRVTDSAAKLEIGAGDFKSQPVTASIPYEGTDCTAEEAVEAVKAVRATAARQVIRKTRECYTCDHEHECYDISPSHGWRQWGGEGQMWYVQPPKGVEEPCGGCGKPRMEHGFDA